MTPRKEGLFCPQCSKPGTGNFCQHCGGKLGGRFCNQCGGKVGAGASFCNQCGHKVAGGSGGSVGHRAAAVAVVGGQNLPWWIAGGAMFVLILFVGINMVRPSGPAVPSASSGGVPAGGVAGPGTLPDLTQMTPIEAAGRLFNRVMQSVSSGDSTEAQAFLPMAIAAYQRARPLDYDGLFHLSLLNRTAMNLEAALDNALEIIEEDPNHLLGLAAAAEAALELGELADVETHYRTVLSIYDAESQRPLPEYEQHAQILSGLKADAEAFLAGR